MAQAVLSDRHRALWQLSDNALGGAGRVITELTSVETRMSLEAMGTAVMADIVCFFDDAEPDVVSIDQPFTGVNDGLGAFMLKESSALMLVRELTRERARLRDMTELEEEACCEIGNIILNSFVGMYAEVSNDRVLSQLPGLSRGHFAQLLKRQRFGRPEDMLFYLRCQISTPKHDFEGCILASGMQWHGLM